MSLFAHSLEFLLYSLSLYNSQSHRTVPVQRVVASVHMIPVSDSHTVMHTCTLCLIPIRLYLPAEPWSVWAQDSLARCTEGCGNFLPDTRCARWPSRLSTPQTKRGTGSSSCRREPSWASSDTPTWWSCTE